MLTNILIYTNAYSFTKSTVMFQAYIHMCTYSDTHSQVEAVTYGGL